MLDKLTIEDFSGRVGDSFAVTPAGAPPLTLMLALVEALPQPPGDKARLPFSLEFVHPGATDHVPQQIVAVEHPQLGIFDLFVVPLGPSPDGMRYEAIFT